MALMTVWPTDAADGSVATEARWRTMARLWAPTGVVIALGNALAPTIAGSNVTVKSGGAWIDGHYCELANDTVLPVTANGLVVVRFDPAANTAELLYRDGAGLSPTQNPAGVWELVIAAVTASALFDRRTFTDGWAPFTPVVKNNVTTANWTAQCFYARNGRTIHARYAIKYVSGSTTGVLYIGLPVPSRTATAPFAFQYAQVCGDASYAGPGGRFGSPAYLNGGGLNTQFYVSGTTGDWSNTVPYATAVGDEIWASLTYEAFS